MTLDSPGCMGSALKSDLRRSPSCAALVHQPTTCIHFSAPNPIDYLIRCLRPQMCAADIYAGALPIDHPLISPLAAPPALLAKLPPLLMVSAVANLPATSWHVFRTFCSLLLRDGAGRALPC